MDNDLHESREKCYIIQNNTNHNNICVYNNTTTTQQHKPAKHNNTVCTSMGHTYPRHWPFVRRIHRSPVDSPNKGQWRGDLIFSLIWKKGWVNNQEWFETPSRSLWCHCNSSSSSSKFYFQQNTAMKQKEKFMVNINKYIKALVHPARGH